MEHWRPMPGCESAYAVSSRGRVRRTLAGAGTRCRVRKTHIGTSGYVGVVISISGRQRSLMVHRLIARAFLGEAPGREVNHINGDKTDNRVENLEWSTHAENGRHAYRTGLRVPAPRGGSQNPRAKLDETQVLAIRQARTRGAILADLAKANGVGISTIHRVCNGIGWQTA